jgi:hypothetical protein
MAVKREGVNCIDCGADRTAYDAPSEPCRECGSLRRNVRVSIEETLRAEDHLAYHAKHPTPTYRAGSKSRPARETWGGEHPSADGVYRKVRRVVDREGDWYEETVRDPDGTLIRDVAEPLSEHRGRGSAKPTRRPQGPRPSISSDG